MRRVLVALQDLRALVAQLGLALLERRGLVALQDLRDLVVLVDRQE